MKWIKRFFCIHRYFDMSPMDPRFVELGRIGKKRHVCVMCGKKKDFNFDDPYPILSRCR